MSTSRIDIDLFPSFCSHLSTYGVYSVLHSIWFETDCTALPVNVMACIFVTISTDFPSFRNRRLGARLDPSDRVRTKTAGEERTNNQYISTGKPMIPLLFGELG